MLICGVDDAGRGSLLGPLVIAGVSLKPSKIKKLSSMGVRDSKKLTPAARERLYEKIIKFFWVNTGCSYPEFIQLNNVYGILLTGISIMIVN